MKRVFVQIMAVAAIALGLQAAFVVPRAGAATTASTQMITPVLAKMEKAGRDLKTLQADIAQQRIDRTLGVKENSTGHIYYKAGAEGKERVLLEYTAPIPETVSVIGDKVVIYQPKAGQIYETTRKGNATKSQSLNFLGMTYSDAATQIREKYSVTLIGDDTIAGRKVTLIQLDPKAKSPGDTVQSILLWVDHQTWLPMQYFIQEKSSKTTITLSAMKPNVELPDSRFEISYPKGIKVLKG